MPPTTAKRDAFGNLIPTVKAQTIPNEEEIVDDDGWEEDKFKKLKEPLDFDCFKPSSYHRIENKKEEILLILEGPFNVPPQTILSFFDLVYLSPISHYCGLMDIVEDVARYAVSQYNERQERSFTFLGVSNADYLWSSISHFFFITLEATHTSTSDNTRRTFQTGVYYPLDRIDLRDVWSFKPVLGDFQMSINEDVVAEEEEDDDGWETESFKCIEGDEPFFEDPQEVSFEIRHESCLIRCHPHCLTFPHIQMLAKFAVDLYNKKIKKKDREIQFVQICSGNHSSLSDCSLYYLVLKAKYSSTGVERTFCTNVQEDHNIGGVGRVRFFKPLKQKERGEVQTRHNEESIVSGDDGWEDGFLMEWQTRMDFDYFNNNSYYSIEDTWILDQLSSKDESVYFSPVSHYCGLIEEVKNAAKYAVTGYNRRKGKTLKFQTLSKANYICSSLCHLYFITLDATDTFSMTKRTFQTIFRYPSKDDVDVWDLWSFKPKELNDVDDSMIGDGDDDDGWETESFKNIEKSLPYDVFGDTGDYDSGKPDLEDPFSMESVAQCAVQMYKKRKGRNLKLVKISKANRALRLRCFVYYLTIEVIDTSSGVERTFLTNVLVPEDIVLPLRVRVFKPIPGC